jgi:probable rRNA maturation factor
MIIIRKAAPGISEQALARFAQRARKAAGLRGQVNVVLTSSRDIRALNRRFRGKDKPTDVLSFPPLPVVADAFSGDIVISADIACRNARLYRHAPAQELKILILHGMLHLAGYDHESDGGEMARKEERLRRELGLSNGLIRRTDHVAHPPSRVRHARRRAR